jgi:hypothetical protein
VNRGTLDGLSYNDWQFYRPIVRGIGTNNYLIDDPAFDPTYPQAQRGRWIRDGGMIRGWIQLSLLGNFSVEPGSTEAFWLIKLPTPAHRPHPTLPVVIGTGMVYWSFTNPNKNVPAIPILADRGFRFVSGNVRGVDDPDEWFQLQVPYRLRFFTGTGSDTNNTATITHNLMTNTIGNESAADHELNWSSAYSGSAQAQPGYMFSQGTTQVVFKSSASTGANRIDWAYKARQDAMTESTIMAALKSTHGAAVTTGTPMMSTRSPFLMTELTALSPYGNIFVSFRYAPADER